MSLKQTPESFWAKVSVRTLGECWPWTGAQNNSGYGTVAWDGTVYVAHRLAAWLLGFVAHPSAPPNRTGSGFVLHSCDSPLCCNPTHWEIGSYAKNQADAYARGRRIPFKGGLTHPNAKLSPSAVQFTRVACRTQADLAALFGVSQTAISLIKRRRSYKWIS